MTKTWVVMIGWKMSSQRSSTTGVDIRIIKCFSNYESAKKLVDLYYEDYDHFQINECDIAE